jgi:WD40 repeat protein
MRLSALAIVLILGGLPCRAEEPTLIGTINGHQGAVRAVAFSPSGNLLASAGDDGCVRLWRKPDGKKAGTLTHGSAMQTLAFSEDGKLVASGGQDGTLKVWEVNSGKGTLAVHSPGSIRELRFTDHDQVLEVAYDTLAVLSQENESFILATGQTVPAHIKFGKQTEYHPHVTAGNVFARALPGEREWKGIHVPAAIEVSWPDSSGLVTLHRALRHESGIKCMAAGPEFDLLASGCYDETIKLWDVYAGACTATLHPKQGDVHCLAFSPNGRILASGGADGTVKFWLMPDGSR